MKSMEKSIFESFILNLGQKSRKSVIITFSDIYWKFLQNLPTNWLEIMKMRTYSYLKRDNYNINIFHYSPQIVA
jgi:hypothetical protein